MEPILNKTSEINFKIFLFKDMPFFYTDSKSNFFETSSDKPIDKELYYGRECIKYNKERYFITELQTMFIRSTKTITISEGRYDDSKYLLEPKPKKLTNTNKEKLKPI